MAIGSSEEREYSVITVLSQDKASIEEGEIFLRFKNWRIFKRLLYDWLGKDIESDIRLMRYKRSLAQNAYLHGIIVPIVRAWIKETTGEKQSHDEVYIYLNSSILGNKPEIRSVLGEEVIVMTGKRFSKMNTKEFTDAVETILQHFALKGLVIPTPKDGKNNTLDDFLTDN